MSSGLCLKITKSYARSVSFVMTSITGFVISRKRDWAIPASCNAIFAALLCSISSSIDVKVPLAIIPSSTQSAPTPEPVPISTTDCAERICARCRKYAPEPDEVSVTPISTPRARADCLTSFSTIKVSAYECGSIITRVMLSSQ